MTIQEIKAIAKERFGKELTDEQAREHLDYIQSKSAISEEEMENVDAGKVGCGNPTKDPPGKIAGNVRYFKLKNQGGSGFVAQMEICWEFYETKTEGGNVQREKTKSGSWHESGYHDICVYAERTVDLKDSDIPSGAEVWLKAIVCGGYDRIAEERYRYIDTASDTAKYEVSGTICFNELKKVEKEET